MVRIKGHSLWAGPLGKLVTSSADAAWFTRQSLARDQLDQQLADYVSKHRLLDGEPDYYAIYLIA